MTRAHLLHPTGSSPARRHGSFAYVTALLVTSMLFLGVPSAGAAAPANDHIADAKVIDRLPYRDYLDTSEATASPDDPACHGAGPTVWYVFTASTDTRLRIESDDFAVSINTGAPGALKQVLCAGSAVFGKQLAVQKGQTIYLMLRNTDVSHVTTLDLHVEEARQNTSPASAHVIKALPFRDAASWLHPRLWYRFTAAEDMWIRASVAFDEEAGLRVWTGVPGALRDAGCESLVEGTSAACRLTAARTYYLEAWHEGLRLSVRASDPYLLVPITGDWTGRGRDRIGWHEEGTFRLSGIKTSGQPADVRYGRSTDVPLVGDWNGDGRDTVGVRRGNRFLLRDANTGGSAHYDFPYGRSTDVPLVGDWNGDGRDTVGVRRGNRFLLRDANTGGSAHYDFPYGYASDRPVTGDWNGNGRDTAGVVRFRSTWHLRNTLNGGPADRTLYELPPLG